MTLKTRLHNIKVWFGEYWTLSITFIFAMAILIFAYGCEPKTASISGSGKMVNRIELQAELERFVARAVTGKEDIERQEQIRSLIFENAIFIAQGGQVNPIGVVTSILALLGIGVTVDDVRLRNERKKQPVLDPSVRR